MAGKVVPCIAGFDPGAEGGIAFLTDGGDLLHVEDMPMIEVAGKKRVSAALLGALLREWAPRLAVIEQVGAMPGQGVSSMFAFGYSAGILFGACAALNIPTTFVQPAAWKRAIKVTKDKGSSRQMAQRLWPAHAARFIRVRDDGRAEAALIAFHGRAQWQRESATEPSRPAQVRLPADPLPW